MAPQPDRAPRAPGDLPETTQEPTAPDDFTVAYALGLIVGEGSFTGTKGRPCLAVKLHAADPEPLAHLRYLFGGTIYGPYAGRTCHYLVWILRGPALRRALPLLMRLPPSRKREQFWLWYFRHRLGRH